MLDVLGFARLLVRKRLAPGFFLRQGHGEQVAVDQGVEGAGRGHMFDLGQLFGHLTHIVQHQVARPRIRLHHQRALIFILGIRVAAVVAVGRIAGFLKGITAGHGGHCIRHHHGRQPLLKGTELPIQLKQALQIDLHLSGSLVAGAVFLVPVDFQLDFGRQDLLGRVGPEYYLRQKQKNENHG